MNNDIRVQNVSFYSVPVGENGSDEFVSVQVAGPRAAVLGVLGGVLQAALFGSAPTGTMGAVPAGAPSTAGEPAAPAAPARAKRAPKAAEPPPASTPIPSAPSAPPAPPAPSAPPASFDDEDEFAAPPPPADPLVGDAFMATVKPLAKVKDVLVAMEALAGFAELPAKEKRTRAEAWFKANAGKVDHFAAAIADGKGEAVQSRAVDCIKVMWVG